MSIWRVQGKKLSRIMSPHNDCLTEISSLIMRKFLIFFSIALMFTFGDDAQRWLEHQTNWQYPTIWSSMQRVQPFCDSQHDLDKRFKHRSVRAVHCAKRSVREDPWPLLGLRPTRCSEASHLERPRRALIRQTFGKMINTTAFRNSFERSAFTNFCFACQWATKTKIY